MRQIVLFLLAGGLAALFNFGSRFVFSLWFPYSVAVVLAFLVGLTTGFILMRLMVFNAAEKAIGPQVAKFLMVNLLALVQTLVISLMLAHWLLPALGVTWQTEALAHAVGLIVPTITSYFGHRYATFR